MKIASIKVMPYRVPLAAPLQIGGHALSEREGWVLSLTSENGRTGLGDCCPLPGYHRETLGDMAAELRVWTRAWTGRSLEDLAAFRSPFPSFQCAVEQAVLELWNDPAPPWSGSLAALLHPGDLDRFETLQAEGWTVFKLKVGHEVEADRAFARALLDRAGPDVRFRFDANARWTLEQAAAFASAFPRDRVDFIEEPVCGAEELAAFQETTGWPVALDESLADHPPGMDSLDGLAALVVKPSRVGGYLRADAWRRSCASAGVRFVLSACYESGVGMAGLARYAAAIRTGEPCGFDTYSRLAEDVLMDRLPFEQSRIAWPPPQVPRLKPRGARVWA